MKEPQQPKDQREFEARIRAAFDAAAEDLDPAIAGRLRAARRTALEAAGRPAEVAPLPVRRGWYLGGAMAATVLLAVLVAAPWRDAPGPVAGESQPQLARGDDAALPVPPTDIAALDFEIVVEDDSLELLEELEFYQWLLEAEQDAG